jgi:hypothetical protein
MCDFFPVKPFTFKCLMRELAGRIVPRSLLVSRPIHPSAVYRTNHMFSPVLLLGIQERRNSKKNQSDKNHLLHLQFHLIPLSLSPVAGVNPILPDWKSATLAIKKCMR